MNLTLESPRDRDAALVRIPLPEKAPEGNAFELRPLGGARKTLIAERDPEGSSVSLLLPATRRSRPRTYAVRPVAEVPAAPGIGATAEPNSLSVSLGGTPFFTFHHGRTYPKPVINPILAPGGANMLREPLPAYAQGEHPWQRGLTLMQGAINGVDCWNEREGPGFGRTVQGRMELAHGPLSLTIRTENTWYAEERPLLTDRRYYRLFDTARDAAVLDVSISVAASHGDLTIGGTKEAGFLCLRVNPSMNADRDGHMENSYGAGDEIGCWNRPAHWVDYWGPVGRETAGFAIFDAPANLRYPTTWHVRAYGLFAPNCWMFRPDHHLAAGERMTFRWRVVIHSGDTRQADIRRRFLDYVDGPRANWE